MSTITIRLALAFLLATPAMAGEITYTASAPLMPMPFSNVAVSIPQFDATLGRLESVLVTATVYVQGTFSVENTANQPTTPIFGGCTGYYFPYSQAMMVSDGTNFFLSHGSSDNGHCVPILAAFDGTIDYGGPSGAVTSFGPLWGSAMSNDASAGSSGAPLTGTLVPANLDAYSGTGTKTVTVGASPGVTGCCSGPILTTFSMSGTVDVRVRYRFAPYPSEFCLHNSYYGNNCPCSTLVPPYSSGFGCPNSQNQGGGRLQPSGQSSLSADNFVISASGLPAQAVCLFFQGTNFTHQGAIFGDGMRCVSGTIVRLRIKSASGGAASYPGAGELPISIKGQITAAGGIRAYQVWYRDPPPFCSAATSNLSSGVATIWTP